MLKKITYIFIVTLFIQMFLVIACGPPDYYYLDIKSLKAFNYDTYLESRIGIDGKVASKDFKIELDFTLDKLNEVSNYLPKHFVNTAYATTVPDPEYFGLKSKIIEFEISCSEDLFGVVAGENLTNKMRIFYFPNKDTYVENRDKISTVARWIDAFNRGLNDPDIKSFIPYFEFNEPIENTEPLVFEVFIKLEDGRTFTEKTAPVIIE
jgi:hypothetical protein